MPFALPAPANSLRRRLLWLLSTLIMLMAILQGLVVYRSTSSQANEIFDYHMRQIALSLRGGVASAPSSEVYTRPFGEEKFDFTIQAWSLEGRPVFRSTEGADLPLTTAEGYSLSVTGGIHYRIFSLRTPSGFISVGQDMEARRELAANLALRSIVPIFLLAPMMLVAIWLVISRSTRPILRTRDLVSNRAVEDFSPLPSTGLPDEVRPLVDEINLLFGKLERAFDAQRGFVADAAHELRTPLAALRLQAQGIQRADGDEARAVAVKRLIGGVDRATRLVEQMLVLARQEASREHPGASEGVDLAALSALAIEDSLPLARAKAIDIGLEGETGVFAQGHPESLRILLRNLLENAVKFTPPTGTITVAIRSVADRAVIAVSDSGPGIPPAERERVFDRFYRLPGQTENGSGLGLAIVQTILERHHGEVALGHSPNLGGLEVIVSLPGTPQGG